MLRPDTRKDMARRRLVLLVASSVALCAVGLGYYQYQRSQGQEALEQAQQALDVPFDEAPDIGQLPFEEAREALTRAEELGADVPRGFSQELLALEYLMAGDLIFAEGALGEARQSDRGWTVRRHLIAAAIARSRANSADALEHVRSARMLDSDAPRAIMMRLDLALDEGDAPAALGAARELVLHHANMAEVQNRLGLALELSEQWSDASVAFARATELDGSMHEAWINLGRRRRAEGELDGATAAFERAIALQSSDADAWLGLGLAHLDLARFEQLASSLDDAKRALARAKELAPEEDAAILGLADAATLEGDELTAIAGYREALALRADRPHGWIKLGNALVRAGQPDAAASAFREAIAREEIGAAYNGLGSALSLLERFDEAEDALEMAAQLDMEDANPLMNLALLHERLGHGDEAAHAWERARARSAAL